jgi:hypothetical protein
VQVVATATCFACSLRSDWVMDLGNVLVNVSMSVPCSTNAVCDSAAVESRSPVRRGLYS